LYIDNRVTTFLTTLYLLYATNSNVSASYTILMINDDDDDDDNSDDDNTKRCY